MITLIKNCRENVLLVCFALVSQLIVVNAKAQNTLESKQALSLVQRNATAIGISDAQLKDVMISKAYHDATLDADLVYLQQSYLGLPVYNSIKSIAFKNGQAVTVSGEPFGVAEHFKNQKSKQPSLQPFDAIVVAAKYLEVTTPVFGKAISTEANNQKVVFGKMGISHENITTELLWVKQDNNDVKLAWQVTIEPLKSSDMWLIQVDAITGKVIGKANLTVNCNWGDHHKELPVLEKEGVVQSEQFTPFAPPPPAVSSAAYRVLPFPIESPLYGSFSVVNDPWLLAGAGNNSGSLGWHNDGTTEYNITRGNNVWSKDDRAGDNEATIGVSTTSSTAAPNYTFGDIFDPVTTPIGVANQKAAITNLFYWNNIAHDVTYQYGFDEASGNFQNDNQGRGGTGGDYVLADAQDGSGSNNANFSTPSDGNRPRMQMFLFGPAPSTILKVNASPTVIPAITAFEAVISANNKLGVHVGSATGDLALYDNGTNNGCIAIPAGSLTGKIALLLYNFGCTASVAVKNAQNAGAVGVIIQLPSNVQAAGYSDGTNNTINIPSVWIDFAPGNSIKTAMQSGTVNITLSGIANDGDLDNGVIVHEYGHGISNRLTGGPANVSCLQNAEQMGEGWSDYYALMLTTNWATATTSDGSKKRPIGNYVIGQDATGKGIRTFPYTTDMTINRWTYDSLRFIPTNASPHSRGEIWAATLWDMTWNIIAIDGINTNLYNASGAGGNSVSMKLVTQGMKLQPCSPGFIDGRNAILKADTMLYNGRYSCAIWNAFARRGMGAGSSQGSSASTTDQTATFTLPSFNYDTTVSICNSFTWYDTTIKTSGIYTHTYLLPGGCSRTVTLNLTILSVSSTFTKTDAGCFGTATGSITVTPTSGVAPYTYRIGTVGAYGSANTFNSLKAGNYRVSILDANGCAGISAQITIGQQPAITGTFTKTDAGCFGSATGSLSVTPTTGSGPYTYRLGNSGSFGSSNSFTALKAGSYKVYIQDANGCIGNVTVVIGQSAAITGTTSVTNVTGCYGGTNGAISVTPTSGTAPYTFSLGNSGIFGASNSFTGLTAGSYTLFIKDGNGCIGSINVTITQPASITQTFAITNTSCFAGTNGSIIATANGGTPPYTYRMGSSGAFGSNASFTGLRAGTYRIYVQDAGGCTFNSAAVVTQPSVVTLSLSKTDLTCINSNNGTITANGNGGTLPYQFKFGTAGNYSATNSFTNLIPGTFRVFIRDANNCGNTSVTATILQSSVPCLPSSLVASKPVVTNTENPFVLLSPNPSSGSFTLTTKANNNTRLELRVIDVNGKIVYSTTGISGQVFKFGDRFATGSYLIEITKDKQRQKIKAIKIK